jgi:NADP-dependent 3-hydroxy acid dehydrogenase YdfG
MRMDLLPRGIQVAQVAPGAAETEFSQVRYKGDDSLAKEVYLGFEPLRAEDVADAILYIATRPAHVSIQDMLIMPAAQASAYHYHKS